MNRTSTWIRAEFAEAPRVVMLKASAMTDLITELGGQAQAEAFLQECCDQHDKPAIVNVRQPDGTLSVRAFRPPSWTHLQLATLIAQVQGSLNAMLDP
jgi:hypothetical protein